MISQLLITGKWLSLLGFLLLSWSVSAQQSDIVIQYEVTYSGKNAARYGGLMPKRKLYVSGPRTCSQTQIDTASGLVPTTIWVNYAIEQALIRIGDALYAAPLYNLGQQAIVPPNGRYDRMGERQIAGYTCTGYQASIENPQMGGDVEIEVWLAKALAITAAADTTITQEDILLARGQLGLPLMKTMTFKSLGVTVTERATHISTDKKRLSRRRHPLPRPRGSTHGSCCLRWKPAKNKRAQLLQLNNRHRSYPMAVVMLL